MAEEPLGRQETAQPRTATTGTPKVRSGWTSCAVDAPMEFSVPPPEALTAPRLGIDFAAATAVHCQLETKKRADGREDLVLTEGRATDLTALLAALRLPDLTPTPDLCTLEMPWVPNLLLLDRQNRWVRPGLPVTGCGKPRAEVSNAVRGLRLTTVSEKVVRQLKSAGAAASGCQQDWSDVIAAETRDPTAPPRSGRVSIPSPAPLRVCVFRVPAQEQQTAQPTGTFEYGSVLPRQRRAAIERAFAALLPATRCSAVAERFAVLQAADVTGGDVVYVELDRCRRVLTTPVYGPPTLAQANDALIALLEK
ncbi:hypothetical protein ACFQGL_12765 [Micromonospora vulcania]|uniref:Uncharacterized protein n=1 Tax=Micromonospora vulcania TaxID=1441873 RepID=A0ABW1H6H6_9ACTN